MNLKSTELKRHQRLVRLISDESEIIEQEIDPLKRKRHIEIIDFLIELQTISSRSLHA